MQLRVEDELSILKWKVKKSFSDSNDSILDIYRDPITMLNFLKRKNK